MVAGDFGPGADLQHRLGAGRERCDRLEHDLPRRQAIRSALGGRRLDAAREVGEHLDVLGFLACRGCARAPRRPPLRRPAPGSVGSFTSIVRLATASTCTVVSAEAARSSSAAALEPHSAHAGRAQTALQRETLLHVGAERSSVHSSLFCAALRRAPSMPERYLAPLGNAIERWMFRAGAVPVLRTRTT